MATAVIDLELSVCGKIICGGSPDDRGDVGGGVETVEPGGQLNQGKLFFVRFANYTS